jgi:hypothetical protein
MSKKQLSRKNAARAPGSRRRRFAVAITWAVMLIVSVSLLAQVNSRKRAKSTSGEVSVASLSAGSPSKEYIYSGGRLVATEEPVSSGCGSPPPTPGSLVATAQTANSVLLSWAISPGADHYEVQRRQNISSAWASLSPNPTTNGLTDTSVGAGITYLYQVRAVDAAGACPSAFSNVDLATTIIFADDPLQGQATIIKAQHVTQLRQAVNAVRLTANIAPASWTNPLNHLDPVRAIDFSELRTRLNDALSPLGFSPIPPDPGIAQGITIYAAQLQTVRDKVK